MKIRNQIRKFIIVEIIHDEKLKDNTSILEDYDSVDVIRTIEFLENQFGFNLNDEDITEENFASIDSIVTLVESRL